MHCDLKRCSKIAGLFASVYIVRNDVNIMLLKWRIASII